MESENKNGFHNYESYQPDHQKKVKTKKTHPKIERINKWLYGHRKYVLAGIVVLAIGLGGIISYLFSQLNFEAATAITTRAEEEKVYSPLTGKEVSEVAAKRPVTAIMIENSPDARPQSGLKEAGVVFETIAEAGITRFLALYQESQPSLVGPVRSLRPYYVDWLAAFDASIAHVGGSAKALNEVRNGSYRDIDQFFNAESYWRVTDRYAPHNVYTNFTKLNALNKAKKYNTSNFSGFVRKDDEKPKKIVVKAQKITVPISSAVYNSSYTYSKKTNSYLRYQGGQPHVDREKGHINPKVVIVLQTAITTVNEDGLRESIKAIGTGKATIFQDGTVIQATWRKKNKKDQLTFLDTDNKQIELNRGQTWITAIPNSLRPSWQ